MKQIKLTQGKFALVDSEDFEWLNQYKWYYHKGYAENHRGTINGKEIKVLMHRLINQTPKDIRTDHINRDKLDNRRINLRNAIGNINQINVGLRKDNTSGYKGISWDKATQKWKSQIQVNSKKISLGYYSNIQGAWLARRWGERAYWGEIL